MSTLMRCFRWLLLLDFCSYLLRYHFSLHGLDVAVQLYYWIPRPLLAYVEYRTCLILREYWLLVRPFAAHYLHNYLHLAGLLLYHGEESVPAERGLLVVLGTSGLVLLHLVDP
jgi:hypothetical protein